MATDQELSHPPALDPVDQLVDRIAGLNADADEIGAGMLAQLVAAARAVRAQRRPPRAAEWTHYVFRCEACGHRGEVYLPGDQYDGVAYTCPAVGCREDSVLEWDDGVRFSDHTVTPPGCIRDGNGLFVTGERVEVMISPSSTPGHLHVRALATKAATSFDSGCYLHDAEARLEFRIEEIRVEHDELRCGARRLGSVPEFSEGFSLALEPGQAALVADAVARVARVSAGAVALDRVVTRPEPNQDGGTSYYALEAMAAAVLLDNADVARALAAADGAYVAPTPAVREQLASPQAWAALQACRHAS